MAIIWMNETVGYDPGPVNLGVVRLDRDRVLIVDAGLDKGRAGKLVRLLTAEGLRPYGVLLTHHHADHTGGTKRLLSAGAEFVAASPIEASLIRQPILQPYCLSGGAAPLPELTIKFLLPPAAPVDVLLEAGPWQVPGASSAQELQIVDLPGHTPGQIGLRVGDILFCGDAMFPAETWRKYGLTYFADMGQALATLDSLDGLSAALAATITGHGEPARIPTQLIELNRTSIEALVAAVETELTTAYSTTGDMSLEEAVQGVCRRLEVEPIDISEHYLHRATVQAVLTHLCRMNRARAHLRGARLGWCPVR